ncbi:MAG: TetR/AcrR family transcriptional regulator [Methylococcales symbiont of Hymedesmia sp. n. MRB-2018]|nr:MAG: TetR/AcrR family transcriptional regulator [Methylococcales symbiont of Hymedesmia sp. n. MRB-2018]KAF3982866.1 MAG: TetR/AcrR family transcriptional regulator [Methylococcales symbiont of Hymedesmia sp. n. MRB-2018]
MARRSEHSQEEIKAMVLNVAETIVIDEGFSELKVRKVAMGIGYTVGSIYMAFDNLSDLVMQVKGRTLDGIAEQLRQVQTEGNAEQNIIDLAIAYQTFAGQNFNRWSMIFEHRLAEDELVPDWYQEKVNLVFSLVDLQFQRLSTKQNEEQSRLAAHALWSGVHGICILSLSAKMDLLGMSSIENTVNLLVESFIKGWKNN